MARRLEDSRSAAAASKLLGEYAGTVRCDGFSSYISLAETTRKFRLAHCRSRVRRKFLALESSFATEAKQVLDLIGTLAWGAGGVVGAGAIVRCARDRASGGVPPQMWSCGEGG